MDERLAKLLSRQHGVATRGQAMAQAGLTRGQLDGMVRRGRLSVPAPGLVSAPGAPTTPQREMMGAVLRCGAGARLVGPRCLALLGIRGFTLADPFGVLVPPRTNRSSRKELLLFRDPAVDDGMARVDGLPMPRPARAVVEVARFLEGAALRSAIDAAAWVGRPGRAELARCAATLPSRYVPAARVRSLVRSGLLDLESEPERRLASVLRGRFGQVETQVWVTPSRRVDLLLREHGLALEYDGSDHRTLAGRARDDDRDAEIRAAGFEPVHVVHEDLRAPAALLRRIERIVEAARITAM